MFDLQSLFRELSQRHRERIVEEEVQLVHHYFADQLDRGATHVEATEGKVQLVDVVDKYEASVHPNDEVNIFGNVFQLLRVCVQ